MAAESGKFAAVLQRLSALESERIRQQEARRQGSAEAASPLESGSSFLADFGQRKASVERDLDEISSAASSKSELESLALQLANLEKMVADASYYLPPYDVQTSQATIKKLKSRLEAASQEVVPKKKFSFRNKGANKPATSPPSSMVAPMVAPSDDATTFKVDDVLIIKDKESCTIVQDSVDLGGEAAELLLSNLSSCKVFLRGRFRALFFHKLTQCEVFAGPVTGSVLLEEVDGCIFMLASHQIRIHSTVSSDFYLRVRSRPIVEDVSRVRFAPYGLDYDGLEADLKASFLDEETGLWDKVDDFKWLRASSSPNWGLVPPDERRTTSFPKP